MATSFATIDDLAALWRPLTASEQERAAVLLETVSSELRVKALRCGKHLDVMAMDEDYKNVLVSVVCDVVARTLMSSTDSEPMTQFSQSVGGYSVSGTYLNAGGGVFIKKSELSRLGLRNQSWGAMNVYAIH